MFSYDIYDLFIHKNPVHFKFKQNTFNDNPNNTVFYNELFITLKTLLPSEGPNKPSVTENSVPITNRVFMDAVFGWWIQDMKPNLSVSGHNSLDHS